jgi:hypothetical protein
MMAHQHVIHPLPLQQDVQMPVAENEPLGLANPGSNVIP